MSKVLMPRATAVWLIDNTALSFLQIAEFCGLHVAEVQAIADGQSSAGLRGVDPIIARILTAEEIKKCENDPQAKMQVNTQGDFVLKYKLRKKYTPLNKRRARPEAVLWIIKEHPNIKESDICKLLSTTRNTINAIRNGTYKEMESLVPRSPVQLGLCSEEELSLAIEKGNK